MTVDYLSYHAAERPQAVALIEGDRAITYQAFACDLWKFTRAIRAFGLPCGSMVAVGCDDFYTHWLLLLAFEHLGIGTASFHSREGLAAQALLGSVDLVLAEPHFPTGGWQTRLMTEDWLQSVRARPDDGPVPGAAQSPEDVIRIVRTSGTTGVPKRFQYLRYMVDARMERLAWLNGDWPQDGALLTTLPISIGGTYGAATMALRIGRPLLVDYRAGMADIPALIRRHRIVRMALLPVQLQHVLEHLPADWVKPERLAVSGFGAPIPAALRRLALERLAYRVADLYGSNEAGLISVARGLDPDGLGIVCPGVEIQIVDEVGEPVPDGTQGQIRVKSESCFRGYQDDQTLTRRMLRGGWFYPGDLGILDGRRLRVVGRVDDQVNLGGAKYALTQLERTALASGGAGVKDVGIVPIASAAGLDEVNIAVVTDGRDDRAVLERMIATLRSIVPGGIHFVRLPEIPRNEMGKIDRAKLKEAIRALRPL